MSDDFFAPPPFSAESALERIRRALREQRSLTERGAARFDWKGQPAVELAVDGKVLRVRLAKHPLRSGDWQVKTLSDGAMVRHWIEDTQRQIARWSDED